MLTEFYEKDIMIIFSISVMDFLDKQVRRSQYMSQVVFVYVI